MRWFLLLICAGSILSAEEEEFQTTAHEIELPGGTLSYQAVTGFIPLYLKEENVADIFFVAYLKEGEEDRPITFIFPGGPGGAGTHETLMGLGPRRLLTADEGRTILPPYRLIDNPQTLLEMTDLVYVDPVGCGYSQVLDEDYLSYFYSVEGDINSLGQFIHNFVSHFDKWNSPKYLAGGSYGSLRCCGLAYHLLKYDLQVHGMMIDGCAIEWSTLQSERDRFLPDGLLLPTFAATAWNYGRLWPEKTLLEVIDYARRFVFDSYLPALLQPSRLTPFQKNAFYRDLADLTGLSIETIRRYKGRIDETIFSKEFLAEERRVLGRLDTRYSSDFDSIAPEGQDPSYKDSFGISAAFKSYLKQELKTDAPPNYTIFSWNVIGQWQIGTYDSKGEPDFLQRLRRTMLYNPHMKVFLGMGYYDCRTPFAAAEYCFDHLDLAPSYKKNLQFEYYEAGHGFLLDYPSLVKLKHDLVRFFQPSN